jgi:hypothetical protein
MLISGGGFCLALPPAVGMRPPADGTELRFSSPADSLRRCPGSTTTDHEEPLRQLRISDS